MILKLLAFKIKVFLYKLYKIIKISNQIKFSLMIMILKLLTFKIKIFLYRKLLFVHIVYKHVSRD
jgi:hypothetical protein